MFQFIVFLIYVATLDAQSSGDYPTGGRYLKSNETKF